MVMTSMIIVIVPGVIAVVLTGVTPVIMPGVVVVVVTVGRGSFSG